MIQTTNPTSIVGPHCQQCGATDYESLETGDQGYTACCNELVMDRCDLYFCDHGCEYPVTQNNEETTCLVHGRGHDR